MGIFHNNALCDIYIGKSAGNKLIQDIRGAKNNVKIVSPYLSPLLIKGLISLRKKGIDVQLITTDEIEDFYGDNKNINQLIIQKRHVDEQAMQSRESMASLAGILLFVMIGSGVVLLPLVFLLQEPKLAFGFIGIVLLFFLRNYLLTEVKNKKIYHYTYRQLFPFKVFISPNPTHGSSVNTTFVHSKIYVIDDEIAYLGSMNFTAKGTKENHETRIRTTDPAAVRKISEEVERLFESSELAERDIQYWGSQLYTEPIN